MATPLMAGIVALTLEANPDLTPTEVQDTLVAGYSSEREILADDIIDFLPYSIIMQTISNWVKKLRHGGKIVIGGIELYEISKIFSQQEIGSEELLIALHGHQSHAWEFKASHITIAELEEILKQHNLQILKKRINGFKMSIEARRI